MPMGQVLSVAVKNSLFRYMWTQAMTFGLEQLEATKGPNLCYIAVTAACLIRASICLTQMRKHQRTKYETAFR